MKAVVSLTPEEEKLFNEQYTDIVKRTTGIPRSELIEDYHRVAGYAHYKFSGTITDKLIEVLGHNPSATDIIMIVDNGFSHFGAECSIRGRRFSGRVNTD